MKTIGFTTEFYTLWEVGEIYAETVYYNGMPIGTNYKQSVVYCQNLSHDLEKAKAKLACEEFEIDLELRGHSSFTRLKSSDVKDRENYYGDDCFSFGKMEGVRFVDATDIWQLERASREEKSPRRRARARRMLIDLGALVRHTWQDSVLIGNSEERVNVTRKYATPEQVAKFKIEAMKGHHFSDGQKVQLEVREIQHFGFETAYGWTSVRVYETKCGKVVRYIGNSPVEMPEEWNKIKATVKHDNYRGAETKLLRIKVEGQAVAV